jgi:hypothetical protein
MNFKILVLASLVVAATIADDTFLMDSDFERYLATTVSYANTAACTTDVSCSAKSGLLASCCAKWTRQTSATATATSLGYYCAPTLLLASTFTYNSIIFTVSACTTTTTVAPATCTANSNCTATNSS